MSSIKSLYFKRMNDIQKPHQLAQYTIKHNKANNVIYHLGGNLDNFKDQIIFFITLFFSIQLIIYNIFWNALISMWESMHHIQIWWNEPTLNLYICTHFKAQRLEVLLPNAFFPSFSRVKECLFQKVCLENTSTVLTLIPGNTHALCQLCWVLQLTVCHCLSYT